MRWFNLKWAFLNIFYYWGIGWSTFALGISERVNRKQEKLLRRREKCML